MSNHQELRKENQALILAIYEAEKAGTEAMAEVMKRTVELYNRRRHVLAEYNAFIAGYNAFRRKIKLRRVEAWEIAAVTKAAKQIPLTSYSPKDDFGIMPAIFKAALKRDFNAMYRLSATTLLPIDQANDDTLSTRRVLAALELFHASETPEQQKAALQRLRDCKETLTKVSLTARK
jgi:hypothetical protein